MVNSDNKYSKMQKNQYDHEAKQWSLSNRDPVVGVFDHHNNWKDYDDFLFKNIDTKNKIALDFGCGPGRNIVKFNDRFKQIDGVDISDFNLKNVKVWCENNNKSVPNLYHNNGTDLSIIPSELYDIVFSTIVMQHICVYEIRFNLFKEYFRVLKNNGYICFQMGFGNSHPNSVNYYDNFYDANGTNSACDVRVEDPGQLKSDLEKIGFIDFDYDIRPVGPGDRHTNWIFFRAKKS
jgi:ubiquinone/menaquinone biosynthesis C-methylase UbiE